MTNLSTIAQDITSFAKLTASEQRAEKRVARAIIREALALAGLDPELAKTIKLEMSTRLTSAMGKAISDRIVPGQKLKGTMRLSASALWRRASPTKRRNTVIHELAHLVANWRAGRRVGHSRLWKAEMVRMGETPKRCHSVPTVPTSQRARQRRANVDRSLLALVNAAAAESPTLAAKLAPTFRVGDVVMFGRGSGEQTRARVERVNGKTLSLITLEARGGRYPAGSKFRAHPKLVTKEA